MDMGLFIFLVFLVFAAVAAISPLRMLWFWTVALVLAVLILALSFFLEMWRRIKIERKGGRP